MRSQSARNLNALLPHRAILSARGGDNSADAGEGDPQGDVSERAERDGRHREDDPFHPTNPHWRPQATGPEGPAGDSPERHCLGEMVNKGFTNPPLAAGSTSRAGKAFPPAIRKRDRTGSRAARRPWRDRALPAPMSAGAAGRRTGTHPHRACAGPTPSRRRVPRPKNSMFGIWSIPAVRCWH